MSLSTKNPHLVLQEFFNNDTVDAAYYIQHDVTLGLVVASWPLVKVSWIPPKSFVPEEDNSNYLWNFLWEYCYFEYVDLALLCAVTPMEVMFHFARAKALRLLFPNGRISNAAHRFFELRSKLEDIEKKVGYLQLTNELQEETKKSELLKTELERLRAKSKDPSSSSSPSV